MFIETIAVTKMAKRNFGEGRIYLVCLHFKVTVHTGESRQEPKQEFEGIGSFGAGVVGCCELPSIGARN